MQYVKQLLSTNVGTEGSLLIPRKIFDTLIGEVDKALIPRSEAAIIIGPSGIPGSSVDLDLMTPNSMDIREVAEGTDFVIDQPEYTNSNFKPAKYGVAIRITKELLEDGKWNLLQNAVETAGKRFAENENSLVVTALDSAANTVGGGAAITIANITRMMQHLDDADYSPTSLFIGMEVLNDLRNIDTFVEFQKIGNTDMLKKGFLGVIYGLNVMKVSTNAGMTSTSSYVTDKKHAYVLVEKRPLTVEGFKLESSDMEGTVVSQRLVVGALRTAAMAKCTTS